MSKPQEGWETEPLPLNGKNGLRGKPDCPPPPKHPSEKPGSRRGKEGPEEEKNPFSENDPFGPPHGMTIRRLEYIGRLHRMAFRSLFVDQGLPPAQASALQVIIHTPGLSQRELADKLRIQRATATVMLQKMERAGYIERRPDPADQRISRIHATPSAVNADRENKRRIDAYFQQCFQDISDSDIEAFDRTLSKMAANIDAVLKKEWQMHSEEESH